MDDSMQSPMSDGHGTPHKRESYLREFMLTQRLDPEYWPLIKGHVDAKQVTEKVIQVLEEHGHHPSEVYSINHDKDVTNVADYLGPHPPTEFRMPGTPKPAHIHMAVRLAPDDTGVTASRLSEWLGAPPGCIEIARSRRWSWMDWLAYLTHIKYQAAGTKHVYDPGEVYTARGKDYRKIYAEHRAEWLAAGRKGNR
ncbi:hypothetical protein OZX73_00820 [Bifidobacterium sp. ESL0775]|uniref:hypothetical protein n=1 Tax=Bifidobacterium sp. ESL0775 TaxID=2983230 RepID=UPI0023F64A7B|nr:hypothetical protein [Bifidobacterium sp. ESL0775]WEV69474.1 hypothetical protein OZX73_00820 [Bifidobacterium sp. ESL0775]